MTPGILELDLHGKNTYQAKVALEAALRRAGAGTYRIRIIHGYHAAPSCATWCAASMARIRASSGSRAASTPASPILSCGNSNLYKEGFPMLFVCYPKCSTCQKAKAWLDAHGVSVTVRDIKTDRPTAEELRAWHARSGLPLKRFFNTSGLQYKALGLKDKLPTMTEDEQLALLATDGMLVKRPLLVADDYVLVGFRENEWEERL